MQQRVFVKRSFTIHHAFVIATAVFWFAAIVLTDMPAFGTPEGWTFLLAFLAVSCLSFFLSVRMSDSLLKNFLLISLLIGIFYVVLRPFAYTIDEEYHFLRSFDLSSGHVFLPETGAEAPAGYSVYAQREAWTIRTVWDNPSLWFSRIGEFESIARIRSASYLPVPYIPSAIGILIARLFRMPLSGIIVFGRLACYLFYVAICALAVSKTRRFKSLIFLVALSTGATRVLGAIHIDSCLIACVLLFISICFHYIFDFEGPETIRVSDMVLLVFSTLMVTSVKYLGYALIMLFVFFLPKNNVNRKKVFFAVLITVFIVAAMQVFYLLKYRGSLDDTGKEGTGFWAQISFILSNPGAFIRMIAKEVNSNPFTSMFSVTETKLGIPAISNVIAFLPIFGALLAQDKPDGTGVWNGNDRRKWGMIVFCAVIPLVIEAMVFTSLYLSWTPVGLDHVHGFQGRYTVPLYILIMTIFGLMPVKNGFKNWNKIISFLSMFAMMNTILGFFRTI